MRIKVMHIAAAMTVALAVPAAAQNTSDPYATQQHDNDDDSGKWGLVGLLGLAGLLGLKRRDRDDHRHTSDGTTNRP